jgi:hypothetical protein
VTGVLAAGALVMVAGTFAPWLQSGTATRNSYRTAGLLQQLLQIGGATGAALDALPLLAAICAGAGVLLAIGWHRVAAGVLAAVALAMSCLSVAALVAPTSGGVRVDTAGPAMVLIGAGLIILACATLVAILRADKAHGRRV